MLIHAVSLFSTERGWKQARNRIWSSRSYGAVFMICSLNPSFRRVRQSWVFESNWIMKPFFFFLKTSSFLCKQHGRVPLWDSQAVCLPVSPGLALFHWMSQFLIDVFSKALLVQSLPVLVLFREITNCSANPSQSSHFKHLEEPVPRTAPRYLGEKFHTTLMTGLHFDVHKKNTLLSLTSDPVLSDVCTLGFWLLGRNRRVNEGGDAVVTTSHSSNV